MRSEAAAIDMVKIFSPDQFSRGKCDFALVNGRFLPADSKEVKYAKLSPPVIMTYEPLDGPFSFYDKDFTLTLTHRGAPICEPIRSTLCVMGPSPNYVMSVQEAIRRGEEFEASLSANMGSTKPKDF
jgi:hypothetical protein